MNNNSIEKTENKDDIVLAEVRKLFKRTHNKNTTITKDYFTQLRNLFNDDVLVSTIQEVFIEKYTELTKRAKKFAKLIKEKYGDNKYPFHILLEKAYKYKVKHNISDDEFSQFQYVYEQELIGTPLNELDVTNETNIAKAFNKIESNNLTSSLSPNDYEILQNIVKLHANNKLLHSNVLLQSIQYEDCTLEALNGEYDKKSHDVSDHVHPVIAALFLPKIDILETHFLHSNIAGIVNDKYLKQPLKSLSDAHLYIAMSQDPNDMVCDSRSTLLDLYNRALLQSQVWKNVLSLRNGKYYNNSFRDFINAVDMCKMNKYDMSNLIYGRYDGTILKRLMSAFSFRPTIITTTPLQQVFSSNPYQQTIIPSVTHVPMINLKLPHPFGEDQSPIELKDALEQTQYLLENNVVVPKQTSLIYSKGVLFFYIDRRSIQFDGIKGHGYSNAPVGISSHFETLNKRCVNYDTIINIRNDEYRLRSVVISEVTSINEKKSGTIGGDNEVIVGSSTLMMNHQNVSKRQFQDEYFIYDPYSVVRTQKNGGSYVKSTPIEIIPGKGINNEEGFMDMARTRGIIFMYQLVHDSSKN